MTAWARWFKFQTFSDPQLERMLMESARFVEQYCWPVKSPRWLSLLGSSGAGKTYLARRIYRWAKTLPFPQSLGDIKYPATWHHWPSVCKDLLERNFEPLESSVSDVVVFLDEIGAATDKTGFLTDQLSNFLCRRTGRWTVITGNVGMKAIREMDARIASRMIRDGSVVVDVDVMDYSLREEK